MGAWLHALLARPERLAILSGSDLQGDFPPWICSYTLQRAIPSARGVATSPSPRRSMRQYRNLDLSSIGCAVRLCLRARLTLIRLALIRKPWSSGEEVSRLLCRYSYLHLLFHKLQHASRHAFSAGGMLPYRYSIVSHGFGKALMPEYYPRRIPRLVSCYALFK